MSEFVNTSIRSIVGRIDLPESHSLFPLYETVINAIQAIKEGNTRKGEIQIYVIREGTKQINTDNSIDKNASIKSFRVVDNGIGFTDKNLSSFREYLTPHKSKLGCKGIGRFLALAAFTKVSINSIYKDEVDKKIYERIIEFDLKNGIVDSKKVSKSNKIKTTVELYNYLDKFSKATSAETIAEKLLQHCLIYFITKSNPKIELFDDAHEEVINLQSIFDNSFSPDDEIDYFNINGTDFELNYIKNYLDKRSHKIHYCGNDREVDDLPISNIIPDFNKPINDDKGKYSVSVYVKSDLLNKSLNDYRNEFSLPKNKTDKKDLFSGVSLEEINEKISEKIKIKYSDFISEFSNEKNSDLKDYIYSNTRYEYLHLLDFPELLASVPSGLSNKDKDYHLHKINYELEVKQKARINEFLSSTNGNIKNSAEYKVLFEELISYENASGKSKLANYMVHRKAVLKIFESFIQLQRDGSYALEEDIHQIIFKKNADSHEIFFNDHNLWILDERVAFSKYIASDKGFKEMEVINVDSDKAPDLFIYGNKFVYGELKDLVVLFEFKRPMRSYYTETEKNLGEQIISYAEDLMKNKARSSSGRPLDITKDTPKFGYIICDYNHDKQHEEFLRLRGYKFSPKGSLFKYEDGINMFIEIMTYDTLLEDVQLRHKAFFNQLGM